MHSNAKISKSTGRENCVGRWFRGRRNNSGQHLIDFCENNDKFICNSTFCHSAKHITTWSTQIKNKQTNPVIKIYNQIDYIIMSRNQIGTLLDSRSYAGTETYSDHRMVVTTLEVIWCNLYNTNKNSSPVKRRFNTQKLVHCKETALKYQTELSESIIKSRSEGIRSIEKLKDSTLKVLNFAGT